MLYMTKCCNKTVVMEFQTPTRGQIPPFGVRIASICLLTNFVFRMKMYCNQIWILVILLKCNCLFESIKQFF